MFLSFNLRQSEALFYRQPIRKKAQKRPRLPKSNFYLLLFFAVVVVVVVVVVFCSTKPDPKSQEEMETTDEAPFLQSIDFFVCLLVCSPDCLLVILFVGHFVSWSFCYPGRGTNPGSFDFRLFSPHLAAPKTTRLLLPPKTNNQVNKQTNKCCLFVGHFVFLSFCYCSY